MGYLYTIYSLLLILHSLTHPPTTNTYTYTHKQTKHFPIKILLLILHSLTHPPLKKNKKKSQYKKTKKKLQKKQKKTTPKKTQK
jgi:hypothetical protein